MAEANGDQPADTAIVFRIGLHLGDLIVDGDDLYGDGVNVAARLEAEAPPGGIVISRDVHEAVAGRLKATFDDLGRARRSRTSSGRSGPFAWSGRRRIGRSPATPCRRRATSAPRRRAALALPDKPSIAVLPFQNMSGDPEQEYFTDGITEDIITELSRFHSLFVIARNSSFSYKGKSPDIRQVGRELGVRYVLEGSIRKSSNRIRVTGQLIDTLTGNHIWAERYDRVLEDIFAVQEEVTRAIVGRDRATDRDRRSNRRRLDDAPTISAPTKSLFGRGPMRGRDRTRRIEHLSIRRSARRRKRWRSTRAACWHCMHLPVLTATLYSFGWRRIGSMPFGKPCGRPRVRSNWTARMRLATRCEGLCVMLGRPARSLSRSARGCAPRPRDEPQRYVRAADSRMSGSWQ